MLRDLCGSLLAERPRLVYSALPEAAEAFTALIGRYPGTRFETTVNEKAAYEAALAGAYGSKRTACLFSARGLYEALDPLMSSAYTGVKGGFVAVCYREEERADATGPVALFSKLPLLAAGSLAEVPALLAFAYEISERYEIPCLLETPLKGRARTKKDTPLLSPGPTEFRKDPARWAATPGFRHRLHEQLNEKIEGIRAEFESWPGNEERRSGSSGTIVHKAAGIPPATGSRLDVATIFPLPVGRVQVFINTVKGVRISEGDYPVIEMQIPDRGKVQGRLLEPRPAAGGRGRDEAPEMLYGFRVVRDVLGPGSSINAAHGMRMGGVTGPLLAVTEEEAFFHSGLPALVNALYNGDDCTLLVRVRGRSGRIRSILEGMGVREVLEIERASELRQKAQGTGHRVILLRGEL